MGSGEVVAWGDRELPRAVPSSRGNTPAWQEVAHHGCANFTVAAEPTAATGGRGMEHSWSFVSWDLVFPAKSGGDERALTRYVFAILTFFLGRTTEVYRD